jgi:hypothetical protein
VKENSVAVAGISDRHNEWLTIYNAGDVSYETGIKNCINFSAIFYGFFRKATDRSSVRRSNWIVH